MRLTGKDRVLTLFDLGAQDGVPASPGTECAAINAIAKTVRYAAKGNTVDVHCPADGSKYLRGTFYSENVDVELAVEGSTGRVALTLGHYYLAECLALSTLALPLFSLTGLLTKDEWNSGGDGPQTQSIAIAGPAEEN